MFLKYFIWAFVAPKGRHKYSQIFDENTPQHLELFVSSAMNFFLSALRRMQVYQLKFRKCSHVNILNKVDLSY